MVLEEGGDLCSGRNFGRKWRSFWAEGWLYCAHSTGKFACAERMDKTGGLEKIRQNMDKKTERMGLTLYTAA
ncbi:unnamed protein product [Allacma fusca]|uniref:Uncharacterized protein n=1 Tax=Allacma fusca TaxID=39272 RepID=A0A8J2P6E9_9HEXA|nr:unnamed protein product [Allacma fusca]